MNSPVDDLLSQARELSAGGQLDSAAQIYRRVLALASDCAAAHFELGVVTLNQGQPNAAIDCIAKAVNIDPDQSHFHAFLGIAHSHLGNLDECARYLQRALELNPEDSFTYNNLGVNHQRLGELDAAERCFRAAIDIHPDFFEGHSNLGDLLRNRGKLAGAAAAYRNALRLRPETPVTQLNLALTLHRLENYAEAAMILDTLATRHSALLGFHDLRGTNLARLKQFPEAIRCYRAAIETEPTNTAPHINLGNLLLDRNDVRGALDSFNRALAINPDDAVAHSNLLLALNYLPESVQEDLYRRSLEFDARHGAPLRAPLPPCRNSRAPDRVLRIGYVSPDFRAHSVAHFTRELLAAHDRDRVEVFCYSNVISPDALTERLVKLADHWLSIVGMTDEEAAQRIRDDQIDILIDLAGHTANNRLPLFARRPAPLQVTWLGYPNTTGLRTIDYRLTDAIADPPGAADATHIERLVRLPNGFLNYQAGNPEPAVAPPPCLERGYVTFGSFNQLHKITPRVTEAWAKILTALPDSRLFLKSKGLADASAQTTCLERFAEYGIAARRIELTDAVPTRAAHLRRYAEVDITLDTFPYNGTTTTFEALWMGVPVICVRGDRHAGRVGASIMHHAGLPELVAENANEYIELALGLAADAERLVALRKTLRSQLRDSVLMNVPLFTRDLERAFRDMWIEWCDSRP